MNTAQKWFDVDAELQKIRKTPPKVAKAPKEEGDFSYFRCFSRGVGEKVQEQRSSLLPPQSKQVLRETKSRPFLPRPLGQEDAVDPFVAWEGLFHWLIDHHPDHFYAVCDAEEAIRALETQGVTNGTEYEAACQELLERFEKARRLKLRHGFKIWLQ